VRLDFRVPYSVTNTSVIATWALTVHSICHVEYVKQTHEQKPASHTDPTKTDPTKTEQTKTDPTKTEQTNRNTNYDILNMLAMFMVCQHSCVYGNAHF